MKISTLAFALGALVLSSGVCIAQEADKGPDRPHPQAPTLQCCQCIGGKSIAPPPLNLSTGTVQWTVNGGQPTYVITSPMSNWVNLPPAKWIQSVNSPSPGDVGTGPFSYATTFSVSKCAIPFTAVQLNGTYAADNGATITMIPPGPSPTSTSTCTAHTYPYCFMAPGESYSFIVPSVPPAPVLRTLNVSVANQVGTVSGLLVNATLDARCPVCPPVVHFDIKKSTGNVQIPGSYSFTVTCSGLGGSYSGQVTVVLPSPGIAGVNVPAGDICVVKETPPAGSWNAPAFTGSGVAVTPGPQPWAAQVGHITANGGVVTVTNLPQVACANPPPATHYDVGGTSTNNVPLNLCYKNSAGECGYNFAVPGTPGGWDLPCPAEVAGNNCCGWNSPVCDREIKKTVTPSPAQSGKPVTVTLTVTNVGTVPCPVVRGINVKDPQLPGLTFQPPAANKPGWSCGFSGPGIIGCTSTSPLLPGSPNAATITFAAKVTTAAGATIKNCAEVTTVGDANQANNKSCVTVKVKKKAGFPTDPQE